MFCPQCGNQVPDGVSFCPQCGSKLGSPANAAAGAAATAGGAAAAGVGAGGAQAQPADYVHSSSRAQTQSAQQGTYQAPQYTQPQYNQGPAAGIRAIRDDRKLWSYILLSFITFGIYAYYYIYKMAQDTNIICAGDGEKTGGLLAFILLSFITLGIYAYYWEYKLQERLRTNAPRYGVTTITQGGGTILAISLGGIGLAILLGMLTGGTFGWVGTIMSYAATYIIIHSLNDLAAAYNRVNGLVYQGV